MALYRHQGSDNSADSDIVRQASTDTGVAKQVDTHHHSQAPGMHGITASG